MNTWNTVSERGYSLVDGRDFIVDAPLDAELRVRTYEGGWAR